jgi:predicted nucleic acid-binding protein
MDEGILDTSTVIALDRISDPSQLPGTPLITAVTLAELAVGPLVAEDESVRTARQAHLLFAEQNFDPLPFDREAARAFAGVAASLRRSGRKTSARAYDAMIAAISIANSMPVHTCNPADFAGIEGLNVVIVELPELTP